MRKQMLEGGMKYNLRNVTWEAREETIDNLIHGNHKKGRRERERQVVQQVLPVVCLKKN